MTPPDEDLYEHPTVDFEDGDQAESKPRFLFAVDGDRPDEVLPLVCDLVKDASGELLIGSPVVLPDQTSLEAPEPRRIGEELAAKYVLEAKQQCDKTPPIDQTTIPGHGRDAIVRTMVERYDIATFITEDEPRSGIRSLLGFEAIDEASIPETCDSIIVSRIEDLDEIESILVPISRGPHSEFAIETGLALARQNDASIELLHVYPSEDEEEPEKGEEVLARGAEILDGYEPAEQTLLEAEDIEETIIEHTESADVTIFGAPREGLLRQFMLGTIPEEVNERAAGTVLIAHRGGAEDSWLDKLI